MPSIFLSASIPTHTRDQRFADSVDRVAIRDAIRALVTAMSDNTVLVFGGHPAITPLISKHLEQRGGEFRNQFVVFQSEYYRPHFIPEVHSFHRVVLTEAVNDHEGQSLALMRNRMMQSEHFDAAVFIGGMEGVWDEYRIFRSIHPESAMLPIGSTGAASHELHSRFFPDRKELGEDRNYLSLFRRILPISTVRRIEGVNG